MTLQSLLSRTRRPNFHFESLESRRLLHNVLLQEGIPDQALELGGAAASVNPAQYIDYEDIDGTFTKMTTNFGAVYVEMFDSLAPQTVSRMLEYINAGDYDNSIFHRLVSGFIIQGGVIRVDNPGQTPIQIQNITSRGTIVNEYAASHPNVERTLAMAKVGPPQGQEPNAESINSATSSFFFNLGDNRTNLDNQNGGFTTFARVYDDASWDVVDTQMGTLSTPGNSTQFPELPEDANGNLAIISDWSVLPENTFTVSSSDPGIVAASLVDGQVSLAPMSSGTATITLTATGAYDGNVLSETFAATVAEPARKYVYTDADGTVVTLTAKNAVPEIEFGGENVAFSTSRGTTTVTGTNVTLNAVDLVDATGNATLTFSAKGGDKSFTIGDVTSATTLTALTAPQGVLLGDVTSTGAVGKVTLAGITGGSLTGATGEIPLTLAVSGAVSDTTVAVPAAGINSLKAASWTGTGTITADNIKALTIIGDFASDVTVTGTAGLGKATIKGAVTDADFNVTAGLSTLTVGSYATGSVTAGAIAKLTSNGAFGASVTSTGTLGTATVKGNVSSPAWSVAGQVNKVTVASWDNAGGNGTIAAAAIGTITSSANFGPDITTSAGAVNVLTVKGTVTGGTWDIASGAKASKVTATDTTAGWIGVFAGNVSAFSVKNTLDGTLSAFTIGTLAAGTLTAPVSVTSTDAAFSLGTLKVGSLVDAEVRSAGNIKSVVVSRGSVRSGIYAGLAAGEASADELGDFVKADARIVSAKFAAPRGSTAFSDSAIIAPVLGTVTLGAIADTAPTIPFYGAAFDTLSTLKFTLDGKTVTIRNPADQAAVDFQLQQQAVTLTNVDIVAL